MNPRATWKMANFLSSWVTTSFLLRTQPHGVNSLQVTYVFWGFHSGEYTYSGLPSYDTVHSGRWAPTFWEEHIAAIRTPETSVYSSGKLVAPTRLYSVHPVAYFPRLWGHQTQKNRRTVKLRIVPHSSLIYHSTIQYYVVLITIEPNYRIISH